MKYPVYIEAMQIARLVNWDPRRIRALWRKHGIAKKVAGRVVTTPAQLAQLWPEQWEALLDKITESSDDGDETYTE